jgi:hypothetical protein
VRKKERFTHRIAPYLCENRSGTQVFLKNACETRITSCVKEKISCVKEKIACIVKKISYDFKIISYVRETISYDFKIISYGIKIISYGIKIIPYGIKIISYVRETISYDFKIISYGIIFIPYDFKIISYVIFFISYVIFSPTPPISQRSNILIFATQRYKEFCRNFAAKPGAAKAAKEGHGRVRAVPLPRGGLPAATRTLLREGLRPYFLTLSLSLSYSRFLCKFAA